MSGKKYLISEAAIKVGIESHVLRYWEEELGLEIERNELGHRFYTEEQIELFKRVKELKDSGLQLRAVKNVLINNTTTEVAAKRDEEVHKDVEIVNKSEDKLAQFEQIMLGIIKRSLSESSDMFSNKISNGVSDKVIKEMDYLLRLKEDAEEERFKRLDETIRSVQRAGKEVAAYKEKDKILPFRKKKGGQTL